MDSQRTFNNKDESKIDKYSQDKVVEFQFQDIASFENFEQPEEKKPLQKKETLKQ